MKVYSLRLINASLTVVLLLIFIATPMAFAEESGTYKNITVDVAYEMIKKKQVSLILDVRNQSEYKLGHLYGAILIPVYELESRIGELQKYKNDPIIVYSKNDSRSQIASQILASHGFTKVYNMLGGIMAWIKAGYPIYTTYHYVTVDMLGEKILLQIDPLLLYQADYASCGCQSCAQNQTSQSTNTSVNFTVTTIEQDNNTTITIITYELNNATYKVTIIQTLLWSYNEFTSEVNRTASFVSIKITTEESSMQFYSLSYIVQHKEYNLTLQTRLTQQDSETYNSSFTTLNYIRAGKSDLVSLELVKFNSSITLSQLYATLSEVAKELSKIYEKDYDKSLAQNYQTMKNELKRLSKIVEKELSTYDRKILKAFAMLADGGSPFDCFLCVANILTTYFTLPQCATCGVCAVACATIFTIWWCLGCIAIPCSLCIITLAGHVYACCMCAEYMGWIDCPWG
ncbi:MAG: rhodanese-like domain-containing protein [Sulfolobales archaeon]